MCSDSTSPEVIEDEWKTADTWRDHSSSKRNLVRTTRRWDTNCHPDDTRPSENAALRPSTKHKGCGVHEANGRPNIFLSLQMTDDRTWPSIVKRQEIMTDRRPWQDQNRKDHTDLSGFPLGQLWMTLLTNDHGCSIPSLMWRCRLMFDWQSLDISKATVGEIRRTIRKTADLQRTKQETTTFR